MRLSVLSCGIACTMIGVLLIFNSCSDSVVYRPKERLPLLSKRVALLKLPVPPGTEPELHETVIGESEKQLAGLPWQQFLTRTSIITKLNENLQLKAAQQQLAENISLAGFPHDDNAKIIGKALDVDLLITIHFEQISCPACSKQNELWLIGQVIRVEDGQVMMRSHLVKKLSKNNPEYILKKALDMTRSQTKIFFHRLRRRWQIERFRSLGDI